MNNVVAPHDALFKKFLTDLGVAKDFLDIYLPEALKKLCNFNSLKIENASFIEPHLKQQHADVLYSLDIAERKAFIYVLVEAQSTPFKLMPFRMLRYQMAIMERYLSAGHSELPVVIPILFYSGQVKPYPFSVNLLDCFNVPELAQNFMFKDLCLIDLAVIPDEEIKTHKSVALLENVMKHVYARDAINLGRSMLELARGGKDLHKFIEPMLEYIIITKKVEDNKRFVEALLPLSGEYKEEFMHYWGTLQQEGFEQGMQKGIEQGLEQGIEQGLEQGIERGKREEAFEIAKNLFLKGMDLELIAEVTGLAKIELERLARRQH